MAYTDIGHTCRGVFCAENSEGQGTASRDARDYATAACAMRRVSPNTPCARGTVLVAIGVCAAARMGGWVVGAPWPSSSRPPEHARFEPNAERGEFLFHRSLYTRGRGGAPVHVRLRADPPLCCRSRPRLVCSTSRCTTIWVAAWHAGPCMCVRVSASETAPFWSYVVAGVSVRSSGMARSSVPRCVQVTAPPDAVDSPTLELRGCCNVEHVFKFAPFPMSAMKAVDAL
ncbi:hypothetical protein C8Q79DRAFT_148070 [Trametes meyenii]|nr:hypothetical protein C8Q79DRAFT_148070 [Trametes meyenii]